MTDPLSVAAGAAGLVSLSLQLLGGCIKGFVLISTARNLGKDGSTIVCMLNLQEIQLTDWASRARLLTGDGLDRRLNARAVETTLKHLQDLLLDTEKLKTKYGLKLVPQTDVKQTTAQLNEATLSETEMVFTGISDATRRQILQRAKVAQESNIFRRLWWAAVDKDKIEKLVADVHFFVRELWHLLEPWRHDDLSDSMGAIMSTLLTVNDRFDQLTALTEALKARPALSPNLQSIATSADIKALQVGLGDDRNVGQPTEPSQRQELLRSLARLSRDELKNLTPLKRTGTLALAEYSNQKVFIEEKPLDPTLRSKIMPRVENLASLLSLPKDETFRSLPCKGIVEYSDKILFVFHHPTPERPAEPRSLIDLFSAKDGIEPPSLSDRLRLALQITRAVRNFHRTGWFHKSLRSENILFFSPSLDEASRLTEPMLAGFTYARFGSPSEISEQPSTDPKCDIYRHPHALGEPTVSFSAVMDAYSLGTILLEIAEWRALRYLVTDVVDVGAAQVPLNQLAEVQPFLLSGRGKGGTAKLRPKMGDIYASVCLMCLGGQIYEAHVVKEGWLGSRESVLDVAVRLLESCKI